MKTLNRIYVRFFIILLLIPSCFCGCIRTEQITLGTVELRPEDIPEFMEYLHDKIINSKSLRYVEVDENGMKRTACVSKKMRETLANSFRPEIQVVESKNMEILEDYPQNWGFEDDTWCVYFPRRDDSKPFVYGIIFITKGPYNHSEGVCTACHVSIYIEFMKEMYDFVENFDINENNNIE